MPPDRRGRVRRIVGVVARAPPRVDRLLGEADRGPVVARLGEEVDEAEADIDARKQLLRKFGYKLG